MILGQHLLLECYDCSMDILDDIKQIETLLVAIAEKLHYTVVTTSFHKFAPQGVSGVVVIQESHISLHTWPEYNYAAVDIFTCGDIEMQAGVDYLIEALEAKDQSKQILQRGFKNT